VKGVVYESVPASSVIDGVVVAAAALDGSTPSVTSRAERMRVVVENAWRSLTDPASPGSVGIGRNWGSGAGVSVDRPSTLGCLRPWSVISPRWRPSAIACGRFLAPTWEAVTERVVSTVADEM